MTDNQIFDEFNKYLVFQGQHLRFTKRLSDFLNVSESEIRFMVYLKVHEYAKSMTEIGRFYGMAAPNISRTVKQLLDQNLIKINKKGLSLTTRGNRVMASLHDAIIAVQNEEKPYEEYISAGNSQY